MERVLNEDEKIRRAEEIYSRRNNKNIRLMEREIQNKKRYIGSKIGFQILILFNLALIVFCIQNKENIFKDEFLEKIISYSDEINLKINSLINYEPLENVDSKDYNSISNTFDENKNISEVEKNKSDLVPNIDSTSSISQMDIDVDNLKKSYKFIKPIEGIVSSIFGARESEYQNVQGYHTGIDIAAETGTKIKSSFNGIVSLVSSEGDYGKHIKVRCNNVTTLYAHCSKILVKEGDFVSEGQEIAEVGSTGNSTGPHLHFEIRVDDRYIDPKRVIDF